MSNGTWTSNSALYITPMEGSQGDAWAREASASGHRGSQRLTAVETVAAPALVASALGLPEGAAVVVRRRLVLLDDQPVELADAYYPEAVAVGTGLADTAKIRGGAVTLLGELGYVAAIVDEEVGARPPTPDERVTLELADHEPVLVLVRRSATADGEPFECAVMTMAARNRRLHYQMKTA
jgi:GntR family transcriptional regulator